MTDYLIRLPWPPTATSPNASGQGKWRAKSEAAKAYKRRCGLECIAKGVRAVPADHVEVYVTFCPPSLRTFDLDNMLARSKQGLDAVAEAIAVDDGDWQRMVLERGDKVKGGCVLVHVKAEGEARDVPFRGSIS